MRPIGLIAAISVFATIACGASDEPTYTYGEFVTQNSAGRDGAYFIPSDRSDPMPVVVFFHGTNGSGASYVDRLAPFAETYGFVVIAPDSRVAPNGQYSWEVGTSPETPTEDFDHTQAVIAELEGLELVEFTPGGWLAAGHSGGASSAPYLASNDERFEAFAVMHGGTVGGGAGDNPVRGWISTGDDDTLRDPVHVLGHFHELVLRDGFEDVTYRVFGGGHQIGDTEAFEVFSWWLSE